MMILLLLIVGLFTGAMAGFFGVGGGILFTPVLFYLFTTIGVEEPAVWAIGTSLLCTFSASLSSTIQQRNEKNIYLKEGLIVGLVGTVGVYFGKEIVMSEWFTDEVFVFMFALLLMLVSVLFVRKSRAIRQENHVDPDLTLVESSGTGFVGGFMASLAGIGGGVVMVPILNLVAKLDLPKSVSISSLAIVFISLSGWLQYALFGGSPVGVTQYTLGFVDFGTALPLLSGAFLGGFIGVKAGVVISGKVTNLLFAFLLFSISLYMLQSLI
jgi:uncharacterized membrane protein YfcA